MSFAPGGWSPEIEPDPPAPLGPMTLLMCLAESCDFGLHNRQGVTIGTAWSPGIAIRGSSEGKSPGLSAQSRNTAPESPQTVFRVQSYRVGARIAFLGRFLGLTCMTRNCLMQVVSGVSASWRVSPRWAQFDVRCCAGAVQNQTPGAPRSPEIEPDGGRVARAPLRIFPKGAKPQSLLI